MQNITEFDLIYCVVQEWVTGELHSSINELLEWSLEELSGILNPDPPTAATPCFDAADGRPLEDSMVLESDTLSIENRKGANGMSAPGSGSMSKTSSGQSLDDGDEFEPSSEHHSVASGSPTISHASSTRWAPLEKNEVSTQCRRSQGSVSSISSF